MYMYIGGKEKEGTGQGVYLYQDPRWDGKSTKFTVHEYRYKHSDK